MARISNKATAAFGESKVSVAHQAMEGFVDFYFKKQGQSFKYLRTEGFDPLSFSNYLEKEKTEYFVAGNLPLEYLEQIKERYPYIISKDEGFTFSVYCFSKNKPAVEIKENVVFSETQNHHKTQFWEKNYTKKDSCMYLDSTQEYSAGFSTYLYEIVKTRHSILNVSAEIDTQRDSTLNPTLVVSIDDSNESLSWKGAEYSWYAQKRGEKTRVYISLLLSGMDIKKHPYARVKVYVWNRDKKNVSVKNLKVEVIESNPQIYGLAEPLE